MAREIAIGVFTALRAVLIFGEWSDLSTRPVRIPRLRSRRAPEPVLAARPDALSY